MLGQPRLHLVGEELDRGSLVRRGRPEKREDGLGDLAPVEILPGGDEERTLALNASTSATLRGSVARSRSILAERPRIRSTAAGNAGRRTFRTSWLVAGTRALV